MSFTLTSSAFESGKPIPKKYTGEGADVSPPLEWKGVPEGTRELALICEDPDAPTKEPWVHWVIYKIPPETTSLPENVAKTSRLSQPPGALQGKNSWPSGQTIGYRGPMPPPGHGRHHYYFRLYALDAKLVIEPGVTKSVLWMNIKDHIVGQAELMGTYER
ncbi:YbhB/YbcL family Raf kinase inhibitor-like protein [Thermopirellula anaerolimosa]